jgi:hypothetical protein
MSKPDLLPPEPMFGLHAARTREQIIGLGQAFANVPVPTLFELVRESDPTAVSGPGRVAHGIIFPMLGGAVYQWHSPPPAGWDVPVQQFGVFESIAEVLAVHGHDGSTILRTLDVTDADNTQLSAPLDRTVPEAFAVVDDSGDVPEWGVWLPAQDKAVTWASPITPVSGRRQAERLTVWRSMPQLHERVAARTGPGHGRIVWLTSRPGRAIVHNARAAHAAHLRHTDHLRRMTVDSAPPLVLTDELRQQLTR